MTEERVSLRSEIDPQYTWNDATIFASAEAWAAELAELNEGLADIRAWQGRLAEDPAIVADALDAIFAFYSRVLKIYVYAAMSASVDATDQEATGRRDQALGLYGQFMGARAFLNPELLAIGREQLDDWQAAEPQLRPYDHYFANLFRLQAHVRSPEV
jgi:oligoendopeptidase F